MDTGNNTVIVTNVSSAIGLAIAEAYLKRGYNVIGNAHTPERLRVPAMLGNPTRFVFFVGDISKPATASALFEKAIERFGRVDILISNTSVFGAKAAAHYSGEDLKNVVDKSLSGVIYPAQQAAKHMCANRQGQIVIVTANVGVQSNERMPALIPSLINGGIAHATRSLAVGLAPHNVKVNAVEAHINGMPLRVVEAGESTTWGALGCVRGNMQYIVDAVLHVTGSELREHLPH
jgi:NAD(P)-dependent dehydrogenase (short-subunit alcohol dehydrogenase family)